MSRAAIMPKPVLLETFDSLQGAHSANELRSQLVAFTRKMGFEKFVYGLQTKVPSFKTRRYFISGYPPGWSARYLVQDYFAVDPVIKLAETSILPVIWGEHAIGVGKVREFWEEAGSFGLNAGVSFFVRNQPGATGIFSLARDRALDFHGQEWAALIGRAQVFANVLHQAVSRFELPELEPVTCALLSARERECLKWAAEGKSTWETGRILNLSDRTVVLHIKNAMRKLRASNKVQAVVRALTLKLI